MNRISDWRFVKLSVIFHLNEDLFDQPGSTETWHYFHDFEPLYQGWQSS